MAFGRIQALQAIYGSKDPALIRNISQRWKVDLIYVGPRERSLYGFDCAAEAAIEAAGFELSFKSGQIQVFRKKAAL
jgi:uncharacterized membrane protein